MNYVFFFADELRADSLACYGNKIVETPNFDKLAREGVQFNQCHIEHPVCSPSRCALFTGTYPHNNGHRTLWNLLKPYEKNLFSYLKEAGYDVYSYGKNDVFSSECIDLFTDEFLTHKDDTIKSGPIYPFGEKGYYNFLYNELADEDEEKTSDYKNVMAGIDFLNNRKDSDKPFILFLPILNPHCPYTVPSKYYHMYDDAQIDLKPICENKPDFHSLIREYRPLNEGDAEKIHSVYLGMVSYTDMLLGKVMKAIEDNNLTENTMLIASSDHGDYAGDYGLVEKWPSALEDVITRVPLIIKSPTTVKGHQVDEIVELFDILPTILESSDIEVGHTHYGKSLIPQLNGGKGNPERIAFCEGGYDTFEPHCSEGTDKESVQWMVNEKNIYNPKHRQQKDYPTSVCRSVMARSLDYKLIRRSNGQNEFYDLKNDPNELNNIYGLEEFTNEQKKLEIALLDFYLTTSDAVPFEEDSRTNKPKFANKKL